MEEFFNRLRSSERFREVGEALSGLGEGLLEGVDEPGGRVVRK
jgi:hypothetical protein